jgi:hypothetical protein
VPRRLRFAGDVIDLIGYMSIPNYNPEDGSQVRLAMARLDSRYEMEPVKKESPVSLEKGIWRRFLPPGPQVLAYAAKRGLTPETVEKFKLGQYKDFLAIPALEEGTLKGVKFRNTGSGMRYWSARGSVTALFNYDDVAYKDDPLLIMKGEIPVMLADQLGFSACCSTGGEGADMSKYSSTLAFSARRVVVGDNDQDEKTRREIVRLTNLRAKALHAEVRFPPEVYKDWDEWLLNEPDECLAVTYEWISGAGRGASLDDTRHDWRSRR